jgi:L-aminopeptidase/D-esterase-like protein
VTDQQLTAAQRATPAGTPRARALGVPCTEEAVANALCAGQEMTGYRGHRVPGLPRDRVAAVFQED